MFGLKLKPGTRTCTLSETSNNLVELGPCLLLDVCLNVHVTLWIAKLLICPTRGWYLRPPLGFSPGLFHIVPPPPNRNYLAISVTSNHVTENGHRNLNAPPPDFSFLIELSFFEPSYRNTSGITFTYCAEKSILRYTGSDNWLVLKHVDPSIELRAMKSHMVL